MKMASFLTAHKGRGVLLAALVCAMFLVLATPAMAVVYPGSISGTIWHWDETQGIETGAPCDVQLFDAETFELLYTMQTLNGAYSFPVDYGSYVIGATDGAGGYRNVYSVNMDSIAGAMPQDVTVDSPTVIQHDLWFSEPLEYSVVGTVTDAGGVPIMGAIVELMEYDPDQLEWFSSYSGRTDFDGTYYVGFFAPTIYKMKVSGPSFAPYYVSEYVQEYWTATGGVALSEFNDPSAGDDVDINAAGVVANSSLTRLPRVSGTVTSDGVTGIGGIDVYAYYPEEVEWGTQWNWAGEAVTAADGTYLLRGLQANDVRIQFQDNSGVYLPQAWSDTNVPPAKSVYDANAMTFTVPNGATETGKDAQLVPAASIAGTVTIEGGSQPASASVTVYTMETDGESTWWNNNEPVDVSAEGTYCIGGLDPAVPIKVQFNSKVDEYLSEWYSDSHEEDVYAAPSIDLIGGSQTEASADLETGATISGHVSDGTNAVAGMEVTICYPDDEAGVIDPEWAGSVATTMTDASGDYFITGLAQGDYGVHFGGTEALLPEFYNNVRSASAATTLSVAYGEVKASIDATLEPAARAIGRFTTKTSVSIADAYVQAYREVYNADEGYYSWESVASTYTAGDGTFGIEGLEPGVYRFRVTHDIYLGGYVTTTTVQADKDGSTDYTLVAGSTKDIGTRQLEKGGAIAGTITVPVGVTEPSLNVTVYKQDGLWFDEVGTAWADATGKYGFAGLPAGKYRVLFGDWSGQCVEEYYADQEFIELSSDVNVSLATTTPLNAALAKGARLVGSIKAGASSVGEGEGSANVYAWDEFWGNWNTQGSGGSTDADGMFAVGGLRPRTAALGYRLMAQYASYDYKWFLNKSYETVGTDGVSLLAGEQKAANFVFAAPGSISGTVTIEGLAPSDYDAEAWAYVGLWKKLSDGTYDWADGTSADETGRYSFDSVAPGQYSLRFSSAGKMDRFNGGGDSFTPFSVISGSSLEFSQNLTDGATLGGTVYGSDGRPASGVSVCLFDITENEVRWEDFEAGDYSFEDLKPGTYHVLASPAGDTPGCPTFFGGVTNPAGHTPSMHVAVASLDTTHNDITLAQGASISGTVTAASSGSPVGEARVNVTPRLTWMTGATDLLSPWFYDRYTYTNPDGSYSVNGLFPSNYRVEFRGTEMYAGQDQSGMPFGYGATAVTAPATASFAVKKAVTISGEVWQQAYVRPRHTLQVNLWFSKTAAGTFTKMTPSVAVGRDGRFSVSGNVPGYYKVEMVDTRGFYLPTYYNKVPFTLITATTEGADVNLGKWYLTNCYPTSAMDTTHYYQVIYPTTYWSTVYSSSYYGGSARKSRYALARHYTQFNGTKYTMYGSKGPSNGKFKVYIDGVYKTTVSTYAARGANRVPLYTVALAPGVHKVKLQTVSSAPVVLDRVYVVGQFQRAARW